MKKILSQWGLILVIIFMALNHFYTPCHSTDSKLTRGFSSGLRQFSSLSVPLPEGKASRLYHFSAEEIVQAFTQ